MDLASWNRTKQNTPTHLFHDRACLPRRRIGVLCGSRLSRPLQHCHLHPPGKSPLGQRVALHVSMGLHWKRGQHEPGNAGPSMGSMSQRVQTLLAWRFLCIEVLVASLAQFGAWAAGELRARCAFAVYRVELLGACHCRRQAQKNALPLGLSCRSSLGDGTPFGTSISGRRGTRGREFSTGLRSHPQCSTRGVLDRHALGLTLLADVSMCMCGAVACVAESLEWFGI